MSWLAYRQKKVTPTGSHIQQKTVRCDDKRQTDGGMEKTAMSEKGVRKANKEVEIEWQ